MKPYFPPSLYVIELCMQGVLATSGSSSDDVDADADNYLWKGGVSNKYKTDDDEDEQF